MAARMSKEAKIKGVQRAIFDRYMETGKDSAVKEIAEYAGMSESQVRSVIEDVVWDRDRPVSVTKESRVVPSRDYGYTTTNAIITEYGPSREWVRKVLAKMCHATAQTGPR